MRYQLAAPSATEIANPAPATTTPGASVGRDLAQDVEMPQVDAVGHESDPGERPPRQQTPQAAGPRRAEHGRREQPGSDDELELVTREYRRRRVRRPERQEGERGERRRPGRPGGSAHVRGGDAQHRQRHAGREVVELGGQSHEQREVGAVGRLDCRHDGDAPRQRQRDEPAEQHRLAAQPRQPPREQREERQRDVEGDLDGERPRLADAAREAAGVVGLAEHAEDEPAGPREHPVAPEHERDDHERDPIRRAGCAARAAARRRASPAPAAPASLALTHGR